MEGVCSIAIRFCGLQYTLGSISDHHAGSDQHSTTRVSDRPSEGTRGSRLSSSVVE
jgi:hypothetical protein